MNEENERGHLSPVERKRTRERVAKHRERKKQEEVARLKAITAEDVWSRNLAALSEAERQALQQRRDRYEQAVEAIAYTLEHLDEGEAYFPDVELAVQHARENEPCFARVEPDEVAELWNPVEEQELARKVLALFRECDPDWINYGIRTRLTRVFFEEFTDRVARYLIENPDNDEGRTPTARQLVENYESHWRQRLARDLEQAGQQPAFRLPPTEAVTVKNRMDREYSRTLQQMVEQTKSFHPVYGRVGIPER